MKISVSYLKEIDNYKEVIKKIESTSADFIHIDVLDNTFAKGETINFDDLKKIEFKKEIDVHLMSSDLDKQIDNYSKLNPKYITIQEEVKDTIKYINKIKNKGIKVGLAINPETDISALYPYLGLIDLVLILSVNPGKGGQKFIMDVIGKLQELKELQDRYYYKIEVDGGVTNENIKYVSNYIDIAVVGSYITDSKDYEEKIDDLKKLID